MQYTIRQHLRYLSNFSRTSVYLQTNLDYIPPLKNISPLYIRIMNHNSEDIKKWIDVVNDAYSIYGEEPIEIETAKKYLTNHPFLRVKSVYFLCDNDEPVGAITIGTYKENDKIGGVSRIAIKKNYRGKGLGKHIISFGYTQLRKSGIKYGQSIVMIKRTLSIMVHFRCGFIPQNKKAYKVFNNQKRFFFIRVFAFVRTSFLYSAYKKRLSEKFKM